MQAELCFDEIIELKVDKNYPEDIIFTL